MMYSWCIHDVFTAYSRCIHSSVFGLMAVCTLGWSRSPFSRMGQFNSSALFVGATACELGNTLKYPQHNSTDLIKAWTMYFPGRGPSWHFEICEDAIKAKTDSQQPCERNRCPVFCGSCCPTYSQTIKVEWCWYGPLWPYPLEGIGVVGPKMHLSLYSQIPSSIIYIYRILALVTPLMIRFT